MQRWLYTWDLSSITHWVPMEPTEKNQLLIKKKKKLTQQVYQSQTRRAYISITSTTWAPHHSILTLPEFKTGKDTHANCFTSSESLRPEKYYSKNPLKHKNTNINYTSSKAFYNVSHCISMPCRKGFQFSCQIIIKFTYL